MIGTGGCRLKKARGKSIVEIIVNFFALDTNIYALVSFAKAMDLSFNRANNFYIQRGDISLNNEKLIIEMLQNLTTSMDDFKTELKQEVSGIRTELKEDIGNLRTELKQEIGAVRTELKQETSSIKTELSDFKKEVHERFDQVDNRLDQVEIRLETVENKMNSMGEMFEHTVELQQDAIAKVNETLQYHKHKIVEHDQELFTIKHKQ